MRINHLRRRQFITVLGGAAVAWPLVARAQQPERMRRIDVLMAYAESDPEGQALVAAFREGLQKLGWTESRNIIASAALTPPALEHPQRASVFAQFPAHCVSRVANPPHRLRQALLRDAELVSPVLYFVGL
jgi:hypothetical protein